MDFAALMSKELSKGKPADSSKKYVKRSEVEAQRKAAYLAEQEALAAEREAKAAAKRKREEEVAAENRTREEKRQKLAEESRRKREEEEAEAEAARRKRLGLPETAPVEETKAEQDDGEEDIPEEELVGKLRELGEPAYLYAETHVAKLRRYRRLTTVMTSGPIPTTLQLVEEKDMKLDGTVPQDREGRRWLFRQLASYFTMVLTEYEKAMARERRDSSASQAAYDTMVRAREDMKPVSLPPLLSPLNSRNHCICSHGISSSASSKRGISTTRSCRPSSRSSPPRSSGGTSTPTMATCVSA